MTHPAPKRINLQNILILKCRSTCNDSVSSQQGSGEESTLSRIASSSYLALQLYRRCFKAKVSQTRLENLGADYFSQQAGSMKGVKI